MKVSVIIPIYKVEKFIAKCAKSLMEQTLTDVEYIFVNDATPDGSINVLKSVLNNYAHSSKNVKIVEHTQNKGLPAVRNTGLSIANGEYIFHCDSDDFIEIDALEQLYISAKEFDADFVYCDFWLNYDKSERYMKQPKCEKPEDLLKSMLSGQMKYNVWNKLVRRRLYEDNCITFPEGHSMGEDMTMLCLAACAKSVAYINKPLYHYVRSNTEAMTQKFSYKQIEDISFNVNRTMSFFDDMSLDLTQYRAFFKLSVKLPLLITDNRDSYRKWNELYADANSYIWRNKNTTLKVRFLQQMAANRFYIGVWFYYQIVYRFIYTILYK